MKVWIDELSGQLFEKKFVPCMLYLVCKTWHVWTSTSHDMS